MKREEAIYGVTVELDKSLCNGCEECVNVCTLDVLGIDAQTGKVKLVNSMVCNGCGECISVCSELAIQFVSIG